MPAQRPEGLGVDGLPRSAEWGVVKAKGSVCDVSELVSREMHSGRQARSVHDV